MRNERDKINPMAAAGIVLFATGAVATLWMSDWRYVVTGLVLMLTAAAISPAFRKDN